MTAHVEVMDLIAQMKAAEQAFVLATVVRTVSVTAAKAGAKAIIRPDGTIVAGWIGGGCARGAVLKAAREALADGEPRMVSVQPEDVLDRARRQARRGPRRHPLRQQFVPEPGHHGHFRRAGVAASLAGDFWREPGGAVAGDAGPATRLSRHPRCPRRRSSRRARGGQRWWKALLLGELNQARRFVVVSTQGKGDEAALRAAVTTKAEYHAFVGSRRKMAALREKLVADGTAQDALARVKAPAGLDLGAITPEEIAMSILGGDHGAAKAEPAGGGQITGVNASEARGSNRAVRNGQWQGDRASEPCRCAE